jgi:O-methyltransferase
MKKIFDMIYNRLLKRFNNVVPLDGEIIKLYNKYKDYTMVYRSTFIDNLILAKKFFNSEGVFVECGVWKGGMAASISEYIKPKKAFLFDSFEGLPSAKPIDGVEAKIWQDNTSGPNYFDNCYADISYAYEAMGKTEMKYEIFKGWFNEVFENLEFNDKISVLRLDADWYDSTMECLSFFYPKVMHGGIIIIDDYYAWDGCSKAVHDYLSRNNSHSRIFSTTNNTMYIIKKIV